jgi:hypothetical protein
MSGELTALLLKALHSLSPEERERVMAELLDARLQLPGSARPPATPAHSELSLGLADPGAHVTALRESLALEAAGPWQTVPVRLPVELHERLRQWCQANNFTMAVVLRGLVARFLDEYAPQSASAAVAPVPDPAPPAQPRR